jgi:hypothetical protein
MDAIRLISTIDRHRGLLERGERERFQANARLLTLLCGDRGRAIRHRAEHGAGPEAGHLFALHDWAQNAAIEEPRSPVREALDTPPGLLAGFSGDAEALWERLAFAERYRETIPESYEDALFLEAAMALGVSGATDWSALAFRAFPGGGRSIQPLKELIEAVGFLPGALIGSAGFRGLPSQYAADGLRALRVLEYEGPKFETALFRHERGRLLDRFVSAGHLAGLRRSGEEAARIEPEGFRIAPAMAKFSDTLRHGFVSERSLHVLQDAFLPDRSARTEAAVRRASAHADIAAHRVWSDRQMEEFAAQYGTTAKRPEWSAREVASEIVDDPTDAAEWLAGSGLILPDAVLDVMKSPAAKLTDELRRLDPGGYNLKKLRHHRCP